jgi:prolyl-tRNA editing enzyme YbaK/EbsC (Cys-tRNA(Pro) deacylase)
VHHRVREFVERARDRYGLDPEVREFEAGTETAAAAAEAVGCDVAQVATSLVFDADGDLLVVVASGANRVSEERVAAAFDADRVTLADADVIRRTVGWSIGGVPPICHEVSLPALFDRTLLEHDTVWAAAGTPASMFPVAPERLRACADATTADVTDATTADVTDAD